MYNEKNSRKLKIIKKSIYFKQCHIERKKKIKDNNNNTQLTTMTIETAPKKTRKDTCSFFTPYPASPHRNAWIACDCFVGIRSLFNDELKRIFWCRNKEKKIVSSASVKFNVVVVAGIGAGSEDTFFLTCTALF